MDTVRFIKCEKCGAKILDGSKFCSQCGEPILQGKNTEEVLKTLTVKPIFLDSKTNGTGGEKGEYVLFGDAPQTIKAKDVSIDESKCYRFNGNECFKGSDGFFYIKLLCCPHEFWEDEAICPSCFSNGEKLIDGEYYYFKIEPIKWRILSRDYQGGIFLLSEKVLINANSYQCGFDVRTIDNKKYNHNNYQYSSVRAYLNGLNGKPYEAEDYSSMGFIDEAFTESAKECIKNTFIENSNNISDKVFLLSKADALNNSFGFISSKERMREFTDYAKGSGVFTEIDQGYEKYTDWWLRDALENTTDVCYIVDNNGEIIKDEAKNVANTLTGVVPGIVIKKS